MPGSSWSVRTILVLALLQPHRCFTRCRCLQNLACNQHEAYSYSLNYSLVIYTALILRGIVVSGVPWYLWRCRLPQTI